MKRYQQKTNHIDDVLLIVRTLGHYYQCLWFSTDKFNIYSSTYFTSGNPIINLHECQPHWLSQILVVDYKEKGVRNWSERQVHLKKGQTHSHTSLATADELFECAWPFCGVCAWISTINQKPELAFLDQLIRTILSMSIIETKIRLGLNFAEADFPQRCSKGLWLKDFFILSLGSNILINTENLQLRLG